MTRMDASEGTLTHLEGSHSEAAAPHLIVLFGATGDLARRKLIPALIHLSQAHLLPEFRVVAVSLDELDDHSFRDNAKKACEEFGRTQISEEEWADFAARLFYVRQSAGAAGLAAKVAGLQETLGPE
ncbi:MAG: glucose-6-phosphate dehydrogenase, partial [Acidimicrobiales bacterium]